MSKAADSESTAIPAHLRTRYPYMFDQAAEQAMPPDWAQRFGNLCKEVDEILSVDKRGFHWLQLKNKLGTARMYWTVRPYERDAHPEPVVEAIKGAVAGACRDLNRPGSDG